MRKINFKSVIKAAGTIALFTVMFAVFPAFVNAAGKVTVTAANGVNIRSNAGTNSVIVASGLKNDTFEVLGSETGSDGYTWYKIQVDANTVGFVRSDFVTADGVSNTTSTTTSTSSGSTAASTEVTEATETEPVTGTVTADVNVREGASTKHKIVTAATKGTKVTIVGYYTDATGTKWYRVNYTNNVMQVDGYIRGDFVNPESEVVDKVLEPEPEPEPIPEPEPEPAPEPVKVYKDYEAVYSEAEDAWYLENYVEGNKLKLTDLYDAYNKVTAVENESNAKLHKKNVLIGFLIAVIVLFIAGAGVGYVFFRKWYYGDYETEEPVNVKKTERTTRHVSVDTDDDDDDDDVRRPVTVKRTTSQVTAHTITPSVEKQTVKATKGMPEGGVKLPDGRIQMPDGSIRRAVVGVKLPDGSIKLPDGRVRKPDGTIVKPEVNVRKTAPLTTTDDDDLEFGFLDLNADGDDD